MEETALPVTEVGPVDFWALRRLASIWRGVDIDGSGMDRRGGQSYFEDSGAVSGFRR